MKNLGIILTAQNLIFIKIKLTEHIQILNICNCCATRYKLLKVQVKLSL